MGNLNLNLTNPIPLRINPNNINTLPRKSPLLPTPQKPAPKIHPAKLYALIKPRPLLPTKH